MVNVSRETYMLPAYDVSRETLERLSTFVGLITRWSARINLVSQGDLQELWSRHIEDSLQLAPIIVDFSPPALDLGSGAGFPGLVIAIATGFPFHLVEADQRKSAFLREAARLTSAPVTIHACRIEKLSLGDFGLVTSRALAPISKILDFAKPLLRPQGSVVLLKGASVERELTQAEPKWHMRVDQWQSRISPDARVLKLSEITLAPSVPSLREAQAFDLKNYRRG